MRHTTVELDDSLVEALALLNQPIDQAVRETVVLELYRRGTISSGKAAQLLGLSKLDFIQFSGGLSVPYFQLSEEDLDAEIGRVRSM